MVKRAMRNICGQEEDFLIFAWRRRRWWFRPGHKVSLLNQVFAKVFRKVEEKKKKK